MSIYFHIFIYVHLCLTDFENQIVSFDKQAMCI